jgi:hypothetical protein
MEMLMLMLMLIAMPVGISLRFRTLISSMLRFSPRCLCLSIIIHLHLHLHLHHLSQKFRLWLAAQSSPRSNPCTTAPSLQKLIDAVPAQLWNIDTDIIDNTSLTSTVHGSAGQTNLLQ